MSIEFKVKTVTELENDLTKQLQDTLQLPIGSGIQALLHSVAMSLFDEQNRMLANIKRIAKQTTLITNVDLESHEKRDKSR